MSLEAKTCQVDRSHQVSIFVSICTSICVNPINLSIPTFAKHGVPGHELDEEDAAKLVNTVRLLLPVASKVSHDPEDEYLTELFQET